MSFTFSTPSPAGYPVPPNPGVGSRVMTHRMNISMESRGDDADTYFDLFDPIDGYGGVGWADPPPGGPTLVARRPLHTNTDKAAAPASATAGRDGTPAELLSDTQGTDYSVALSDATLSAGSSGLNSTYVNVSGYFAGHGHDSTWRARRGPLGSQPQSPNVSLYGSFSAAGLATTGQDWPGASLLGITAFAGDAAPADGAEYFFTPSHSPADDRLAATGQAEEAGMGYTRRYSWHRHKGLYGKSPSPQPSVGAETARNEPATRTPAELKNLTDGAAFRREAFMSFTRTRWGAATEASFRAKAPVPSAAVAVPSPPVAAVPGPSPLAGAHVRSGAAARGDSSRDYYTFYAQSRASAAAERRRQTRAHSPPAAPLPVHSPRAVTRTSVHLVRREHVSLLRNRARSAKVGLPPCCLVVEGRRPHDSSGNATTAAVPASVDQPAECWEFTSSTSSAQRASKARCDVPQHLRLTGSDLAYGVSSTVISLHAAAAAEASAAQAPWPSLVLDTLSSTFATLRGGGAAPAPASHSARDDLLGGVDEGLCMTSCCAALSIVLLKDDLYRDLLALGPSRDSDNAASPSSTSSSSSSSSSCSDTDGDTSGCGCVPASRLLQPYWDAMRPVTPGGSPLMGARLEGVTMARVRGVPDVSRVLTLARKNLSADDQQRGCVMVTASLLTRHASASSVQSVSSSEDYPEALLSTFTLLAGTVAAVRAALTAATVPATERLVQLSLRGPRLVSALCHRRQMPTDEWEAAAGLLDGMRLQSSEPPVAGRVKRMLETTTAKLKTLAKHQREVAAAVAEKRARIARTYGTVDAVSRAADTGGGDRGKVSSFIRQRAGPRAVPKAELAQLVGLLRTERVLSHATAQCEEFWSEYRRLLLAQNDFFPRVFQMTRYSLVPAAAAAQQQRWPSSGDSGGGGLLPPSPMDSCAENPLDPLGEGPRRPGDPRRSSLTWPTAALRRWATSVPVPNVFAGDQSRCSLRCPLPFRAGDGLTESAFGMVASDAVVGSPNERSAPAQRYAAPVETVVLLDSLSTAKGDAGDESPLRYVDRTTVQMEVDVVQRQRVVSTRWEKMHFDEVCLPARQGRGGGDSVVKRAVSYDSAILTSVFDDFTAGHNVAIMGMAAGPPKGSALRASRDTLLTSYVPAMVVRVLARPGWELFISACETLSGQHARDHARLFHDDVPPELLLDADDDAARGVLPEDRPGCLPFRAAWTPAGPVLEGALFLRVTSTAQVADLMASALVARSTGEGNFFVNLLLRQPGGATATAPGVAPILSNGHVKAGQPAAPTAAVAGTAADVLLSSMSISLSPTTTLYDNVGHLETYAMAHGKNLLAPPYCKRVVVVADVAACFRHQSNRAIRRLAEMRDSVTFQRMTAPWSLRNYHGYLVTMAALLRDPKSDSSYTHSESASMGVTTLNTEDDASYSDRPPRGSGGSSRTATAAAQPRSSSEPSANGKAVDSSGNSSGRWFTHATWSLMQRMAGVAADMLQAGPPSAAGAGGGPPPHPLALTADGRLYSLLAPPSPGETGYLLGTAPPRAGAALRRESPAGEALRPTQPQQWTPPLRHSSTPARGEPSRSVAVTKITTPLPTLAGRRTPRTLTRPKPLTAFTNGNLKTRAVPENPLGNSLLNSAHRRPEHMPSDILADDIASAVGTPIDTPSVPPVRVPPLDRQSDDTPYSPPLTRRSAFKKNPASSAAGSPVRPGPNLPPVASISRHRRTSELPAPFTPNRPTAAGAGLSSTILSDTPNEALRRSLRGLAPEPEPARPRKAAKDRKVRVLEIQQRGKPPRGNVSRWVKPIAMTDVSGAVAASFKSEPVPAGPALGASGGPSQGWNPRRFSSAPPASGAAVDDDATAGPRRVPPAPAAPKIIKTTVRDREIDFERNF